MKVRYLSSDKQTSDLSEDNRGKSEALWIDVWEIVKFYYCRRELYLLLTLGAPFIAKRKMTYGADEHKKERKRLSERTSIFGFEASQVKKVYNKLMVEDSTLRLSGQVDNVLELTDGQVIPVEIKYTDYVGAYRHRTKQLTAYAVLLQHHFNRKVDKGILYFPIQNKQIFLPISMQDKKSLIVDLERIRELIRSEKVPPKARSEACRYCEVKRYCA